MSTNAMNFGPAWMRGDTPVRPSRGGTGTSTEGEGRSSPHVGHSNGTTQPFSPTADTSLNSPGVNGTSSYARTSSYSSILASTPSAQSPGGNDGAGNGTANHDKPFKYSRDEMLNIWKSNAVKFKSSGIPLEFERHETFTSEEPLEPALLSEMTPVEQEAFAGPLNSDKPDLTMPGRLDRAGGRQFTPKTERYQPGVPGSTTRSPVTTRNRTSSRGESGGLPFSTNRPTPRTTRSRDYFTGAFAGSSSFSSGGGSPPEKDIWGSATKKGNFDENGKFVVTEDERESLPLESEDHQEDTSSFAVTSGDLLEPVSAPEKSESPAQVTDTFGLPAEGGRSTSRFASFGLSDEPISILADEDSHPPAPHDTLQSGGQFGEDHEDDVLNDILSMTGDQPGLRQMDRLTSRFAAQSLNPDPAQYNTFNPIGTFDSDPSVLRRDSGPMPQFYPHPGPPQPGLFEHPVVPAQPALPPAPPQTTRVMIMADKLKWVYKDPHGNVQGPFTGLEMHEWYRGGYFHATLEVKREDDPHFEQLQMLVKRIGNQREPFLVPLPSKTQTQLIPPRSTTTLSGWNTTLFGEGLDDTKWTTPTLQQAALSGTTLTADQQNALERRKQEEQYMLVRQREIAPAPQQIPLPMQQHPLHHPAPFAVPPQPAYPPYGGLHPLPHGVTHHVLTPAPVQVQTLPALDSLRTGAAPTTPPQPAPAQTPVDRQGQGNVPFQAQQNRNFVSPWGAGPLGPLSPSMGQLPQQSSPQLASDETPAVPFEEERPTNFPTESHFENYEEPELAQIESRKSSVSVKPEILSPLAQAEVTEEVLLEPELEPEVLSEEPSLDTTSISPARAAPWAKKDESAKKASLSLKQIQEMEAKRAAEQARRLSEQRQLLAQQQQATIIPQAVPQPGLPQGSTWGSVAAKGWAGKVTTTPTPSPGKKTMAQIQKEEEEERARLAKSKEANVTTTPGRGYAGVAATVTPKPAMPIPAWTVVGPGGRPQPGRPLSGSSPAVPVPPAQAQPHTTVSPVRAAPTPPKAVPIKSSPQPPSNGNVEEFQKWCRSQLKSLSGVNYDEIYQMMVSLPPNESTTQEIISDTVYTHSPTLDGRHFAEEFLKRRRALGTAIDATLATPSSLSSSGSGSGWNEVLKKEKPRDASGEWNSAFKVVAGKKGRRRG